MSDQEYRYADVVPSTRDDAFDSAMKAQVSIPLFRQLRSTNSRNDSLVYWTPIFSTNALISYGDDDQQRFSNIENFCKFSYNRWNLLHLRVLDLRDDFDLDDRYSRNNLGAPFLIDPSTSLASVLEDITSYRNEIRSRTARLHIAEMSNRRLSVFLLNMDDADVRSLDEEHRELLEDLVLNSSFERVYVIPLVSSARIFSEDFTRRMEWSAFLGEDNISYARDEIFTNLSDGTFDVRVEIVGVLRQAGLDRFTVLHSIDRRKPSWVKTMENVRQNEQAVYDSYLSTLDDGSMS